MHTPAATEDQNSTPPTQPASPLSDLLPGTPQEIAVTVCAVGLAAVFFAPWAKHYQYLSGATSYRLDRSMMLLWLIPVLALATFFRRQGKVARRWFGTITAIVTWLGLLYFALKCLSLGIRPFAWGGSLTVWLSLGLFAFSGDRRLTAPLDLVARKLSSRKASVYSHWGTLTPDIHFSTQEFYAAVETAIRAKAWPGAETLRIHYTEAGLLSHKREYLRVIRQRQVFDICAATFGKDYFFSVREAEIPAVVDARAFFVVMAALFLLFFTCIQTFGILLGPPAVFFPLIFGVWFLFNVLRLGLTKVDSALVQLPVIGAVYEAWFRRDTYFQQDTRIVFLQSVNEMVKRHVEATTSEKEITFLNCFEKQPILDGLYTRSRVSVGAQTPPVAKA